jgi:hypothetical protein
MTKFVMFFHEALQSYLLAVQQITPVFAYMVSMICFFLNIEHPCWRTYTICKIFSSLKEISHDQTCFLLFILRLLGENKR